MIEFTLPWPPKELSPNARMHWATLARWKKKYRHACGMTALEQLGQAGKLSLLETDNLTLTMVFYPPQRREYDRDNLSARMKSGLDGLCDTLKIDDKLFKTVSVTVSPDIGGFVKIFISKGEKHGSTKNQRSGR